VDALGACCARCPASAFTGMGGVWCTTTVDGACPMAPEAARIFSLHSGATVVSAAELLCTGCSRGLHARCPPRSRTPRGGTAAARASFTGIGGTACTSTRRAGAAGAGAGAESGAWAAAGGVAASGSLSLLRCMLEGEGGACKSRRGGSMGCAAACQAGSANMESSCDAWLLPCGEARGVPGAPVSTGGIQGCSVAGGACAGSVAATGRKAADVAGGACANSVAAAGRKAAGCSGCRPITCEGWYLCIICTGYSDACGPVWIGCCQ
jgi:hypothetical protein